MLALAPASTNALMAGALPASAAMISGVRGWAGGGGGRVPSARASFWPPPAADATCTGGVAAGGGTLMALASTPLDRTILISSALPLAAATWISWRPWLSRCSRSVPRDTAVTAKGTLLLATAAATTEVPSGKVALLLAPASRSASGAEGSLLRREKNKGVKPLTE